MQTKLSIDWTSIHLLHFRGKLVIRTDGLSEDHLQTRSGLQLLRVNITSTNTTTTANSQEDISSATAPHIKTHTHAAEIKDIKAHELKSTYITSFREKSVRRKENISDLTARNHIEMKFFLPITFTLLFARCFNRYFSSSSLLPLLLSRTTKSGSLL